MATNQDMAQAMADFADGLAEYRHLPLLAIVGFGLRPEPVWARTAVDAAPVVVRRVAEWADVFNTNVVIDLATLDKGYAVISTVVEIAGRTVNLSENISALEYRQVERLFGLGRLESGDSIELHGSRLLAAIVKGAA